MSLKTLEQFKEYVILAKSKTTIKETISFLDKTLKVIEDSKCTDITDFLEYVKTQGKGCMGSTGSYDECMNFISGNMMDQNHLDFFFYIQLDGLLQQFYMSGVEIEYTDGHKFTTKDPFNIL